MSNGNPAAGQNMPNVNSLIKPEQVMKLPYFPEGQKQKYFQGITKLWEAINSQPQQSPGYQHAYQKLVEVSMNIKKSIDKAKLEAAAPPQQNGGRPPNQQGPQGNQPPTQAATLQQGPEQYSQRVMQKVNALTILVPPHLVAQHGQEGKPVYVNEMRRKYAKALHTFDQAEGKIKQMEEMQKQRNSAGRSFNQEEQANFTKQQTVLSQQKDGALEFIRSFHKQQESVKVQLERIQAGSGENDPNAQATKQENTNMGGSSQAPEHQGQAHTVSSALDAARNQGNVPGRPTAMSPPNSNQPSQQPAVNQPSNSHQAQLPPNSQAHLNNIKAEAPHQNSPGMSASHPVHPGDPQPLKHEDALEKARSYSNPGYPQNTPQSATHGHPQQHNQREGQLNSHSKMPVPKDLHIPAPSPVAMGSSRPTMTNGPLMGGPVGQPAIQRTPGFVLEGDGERVLSKKKLEELVRQVTGGTGGESEDGESITADVEEVSRSSHLPL